MVIIVAFMQLLWVVACPSCCWRPAGATDGIFLEHLSDLCCLPHPQAATTSHHSDLLLLSVLLGCCRSSCHSPLNIPCADFTSEVNTLSQRQEHACTPPRDSYSTLMLPSCKLSI